MKYVAAFLACLGIGQNLLFPNDALATTYSFVEDVTPFAPGEIEAFVVTDQKITLGDVIDFTANFSGGPFEGGRRFLGFFIARTIGPGETPGTLGFDVVWSVDGLGQAPLHLLEGYDNSYFFEITDTDTISQLHWIATLVAPNDPVAVYTLRALAGAASFGATPLPSAFALFATGLGFLGFAARRRKRGGVLLLEVPAAP